MSVEVPPLDVNDRSEEELTSDVLQTITELFASVKADNIKLKLEIEALKNKALTSDEVSQIVVAHQQAHAAALDDIKSELDSLKTQPLQSSQVLQSPEISENQPSPTIVEEQPVRTRRQVLNRVSSMIVAIAQDTGPVSAQGRPNRFIEFQKPHLANQHKERIERAVSHQQCAVNSACPIIEKDIKEKKDALRSEILELKSHSSQDIRTRYEIAIREHQISLLSLQRIQDLMDSNIDDNKRVNLEKESEQVRLEINNTTSLVNNIAREFKNAYPEEELPII